MKNKRTLMTTIHRFVTDLQEIHGIEALPLIKFRTVAVGQQMASEYLDMNRYSYSNATRDGLFAQGVGTVTDCIVHWPTERDDD